MIQGKTKTEKEYRAIGKDSSSSLKEFALNKRKYHKKYILNEKVEEDENKATTIGSLVECLLWEKEKFDDKFAMSSLAKAPTGKMLDFCNALVNLTIAATDEEGNVTKSFEEMATEARVTAQFEWKLPAILDKFIGKDPEIYYKESREIRSKGLIVVTLDDVQNAEKIVNELKINEFTAPIINLVNSSRYDVRIQFKIEDYEIDGVSLKSMTDLIVIDHKEKTIQVYDLKVVWSVEGFYYEYYLYRLAYIQAYLYYQVGYKIREIEGLKNYLILPPKFIVADSINYFSPLIYSLNYDDLEDAYNGFEYKGRKYEGVKSIIENLKWAKENNIWNISRENYINEGVVNLRG